MQIFKLNDNIEPKLVDGTLIKTRKHEVVNGAYTYEFKSDSGQLYLTALGGRLQEATYECRGLFPWSKKRVLKGLLRDYGMDKSWTRLSSNRSGYLYHDPQELFYATWDSKSNYVSIGVLAFREEMQRTVT